MIRALPHFAGVLPSATVMSFKPFDRESKPLAQAPAPLAHAVHESMSDYFRALNGHAPADLYNIILAQVEPPLLKATLAYCRGNQSKAADVLGLNRATLRKKLSQYKISAKSAGSSALSNSRRESTGLTLDRRS